MRGRATPYRTVNTLSNRQHVSHDSLKFILDVCREWKNGFRGLRNGHEDPCIVVKCSKRTYDDTRRSSSSYIFYSLSFDDKFYHVNASDTYSKHNRHVSKGFQQKGLDERRWRLERDFFGRKNCVRIDGQNKHTSFRTETCNILNLL